MPSICQKAMRVQAPEVALVIFDPDTKISGKIGEENKSHCTLWWTNIAMERSTMLFMGKSTISTGPFSIAIYVCLPGWVSMIDPDIQIQNSWFSSWFSWVANAYSRSQSGVSLQPQIGTSWRMGGTFRWSKSGRFLKFKSDHFPIGCWLVGGFYQWYTEIYRGIPIIFPKKTWGFSWILDPRDFFFPFGAPVNSSLPPNFAMHGGVCRQQRQGLQGLVRQHGRQQGDISKQTPAVEEPIDGWLPWHEMWGSCLTVSRTISDTLW